ncbi:hypothetical protein DFH09DRAFT_1246347 [Mycena vulgaris]|nr:hypothetical protein DFH09DRAFT_1246347 [Mycena vulgaris]
MHWPRLAETTPKLILQMVIRLTESVYKIKRTWDHYSCSCPSRAIDSRTCKHLLDLLGEAHETARLKLKDPDSPLLHAPKRKSKPHRVTMPEAPQKDSADMAKTGSSIVGVDGTVPQLLLAKVWDVDDGPDPTGWWISEKLDGVRTFYDGKQLISRLGNRFSPPDAFMQQFPKDITLDGELFVGRGKFSATVSIVRTIDSPKWGDIKFHAFDIPSMETQPFEARMDELKSLFGPRGKFKSKQIKIVKQTEARSREHVIQELKAVEALGGEGLMLRKPQSLYVSKRSSTLLKIKTFFDAEAKVEDYLPGKGRLVGTVGSLVCRMESGKIFSVGSGLTDDDRRNPPSVGCIIVYRFQELSKDGIPRFPTFVGLSADKVMAKDADIPVNRIGGSKSS